MKETLVRLTNLALTLVLLSTPFTTSVSARSLPQPVPPGPLLANPYVSEPVAPADTRGLPPARAVELYAGEPRAMESGFPLPGRERTAYAPAVHDPAVQLAPGKVSMPIPSINFEGLGNTTSVLPPDTDGQVGPNDYVQIVNLTVVGVYDKDTGALKYPAFLLGDLWPAGDPCHRNYGDPVVLYDQLADRWLLTQFQVDGPHYECIAISKTGTPTNNPNDWYLYSFLVHDTKMNDYPKLGVWPDGYYMSANQFGGGETGVWVFDRAQMLDGHSATFQYFDLLSLGYSGLLPSNLMGDTPPPTGAPNYFMSVDQDWSGTDDVLHIFEFYTDWTTPANSTFGLAADLVVDSFDWNMCGGARSCIPQPGTTRGLDALSDRLMMHLWYRNFGDHESLVVNHTVDAGTDHAGIRWYEIRGGTVDATLADAAIYQQGTYAPDSEHRWMGSIAMDRAGNIALGYSVSSSSVYPSIRYAGRLAGAPPGVLPQAEVEVIAGSGSQTHSAARWGDYSAMSVDPLDDCTFWYTQEYIETTGTAPWRTRIASFKFPNCSLGQYGALNGAITDSSTSDPIVGASVLAAGLVPTNTGSATSGAGGAYAMMLPVDTYTVTALAYGYRPNAISGASVLSGTTTTQNIPLTPAAAYVVSVAITDAITGWPLYASIDVDGYPGDTLWNDPLTGFYSVTLAEGISYTFNVAAWVNGYHVASRAVGPLTANETQGFGLDADLTACIAPGYEQVLLFYDGFEAGRLGPSWNVAIPTDGYAVDDVTIVVGCVPQTGGLVVGNVYDENTSAPLSGAQVANDSGEATTAGDTPDDPAADDGFYTIFSPASSHIFTATMTNYGPDADPVTVVQSDTVRRDFDLPAGWLSFVPPALEATLDVGLSTTQLLTLTNDGGLAANFEFVELDQGAAPLAPIEKPPYIVKPFKQSRLTAQSLALDPPPAAPPYAAGDIVQSWPISLTYGWGLGYNTQAADMWIGNLAAAGGDDLNYRFLPDGANTGDTIDTSPWAGDFGADMTYNPNTGTLWQVDVGGDDCIHELNPASMTTTGNTSCPAFSASQRGLAYDPTTDVYFAGSWNDQMVYRFAPDGTILEAVFVGLSISGLAYNPDTQHLFAQTSNIVPDTYVLDAAGGFALLGHFSIAGLGDGAGMGMDCDGNLWIVDQANQLVFQVDSGETTSMCSFDVPWLSEYPITGAVPSSSDAGVAVTLDAGKVDQPGDYYAHLKIKHDTPYDVANVPVTMTVDAPATWGRLAGVVASLGYCDADPALLEKAAILIEAGSGMTVTLTTDEYGHYTWWMDQSHSPLTVTVTHPDHEMGLASGVTITGQVTTTQDFDLRWLSPCVSVAPPFMEATVLRGGSETQTLTLFNDGAVSTSFELREKLGAAPDSFDGDAPWLAEDPVSGAVAADSTFLVNITFTAFPTMTSGVYTATLVADTDDPVNGTLGVNIPVTMTVVISAPVCDFISSSPDDVGQTTYFTNTSAGDPPPTYRWSFGDGSAISAAEHPTHTYPHIGFYTAVLTATNVYGEDVCSATVSIEGVEGGFISNSPVPLGASMVFTNTTQANPAIKRYFWTFGDGASSENEHPQHTFAATGVYTVTLFAANVLYAPDNVYDIYQDTVEVTSTITYLPVVMRSYISAPDLVVAGLVAASNAVTVTIKNQGNSPTAVGTEFWVDVYIDPDTEPTRVNQTWDMLGSQGLVWGVTEDALPLYPGEVLTLTVNDDYYWPDKSAVSWPLPAGTPIWAQVDSANTNTDYGAVLESHEITAGEYNNVSGPVFSTATFGVTGDR